MHSNGLLSNYTVQYKLQNSQNDTAELHILESEIVLQDLQPFTLYQVKVSCVLWKIIIILNNNILKLFSEATLQLLLVYLFYISELIFFSLKKVRASTKQNTLLGEWSNVTKFKTAEGSMYFSPATS